MNYALLIYEDKDAYADGEEGEAWKSVIAAHHAYAAELTEAGLLRGGAGLKSASLATSVRAKGGQRAVHDGPYAETREELGGVYLIEVEDLDAAIAWARKLPLSGDGQVEIRPLLDM